MRERERESPCPMPSQKQLPFQVQTCLDPCPDYRRHNLCPCVPEASPVKLRARLPNPLRGCSLESVKQENRRQPFNLYKLVWFTIIDKHVMIS